MSATRLCLGAVETWDEIEARSHDGQLLDGRPVFQFARQIGGEVTLRDFIFDDQLTREHTIMCPRVTEPLRTRQRASVS
eukprot:6178887-Pleurochrysis_carterae.AAC.1